jgi:hypothetical protein
VTTDVTVSVPPRKPWYPLALGVLYTGIGIGQWAVLGFSWFIVWALTLAVLSLGLAIYRGVRRRQWFDHEVDQLIASNRVEL